MQFSKIFLSETIKPRAFIFGIRGLFDKFEENVYKIVSVYSILLGFAYDTGKYV